MCAAITRWVQYDPSSKGSASDGGTGGVGTRGYSLGYASVGDTFTVGPSTNKMYLNIDGNSDTITLYSGTNLDPRFIARDITEKMRNLHPEYTGWANATCLWEPAVASDVSYGNHFKIYSGTLGATSNVVVSSGINSAHTLLGWGTSSEIGGNNNSTYFNNYGGDLTVSGTYLGFMDEMYKIVITTDQGSGWSAVRGIDSPVKNSGSNNYDGTLTTAGVFNSTVDYTYTISINAANGATMGAGTGNVPTMTWTSTPTGDDSTTPVELLYPDHWYYVGSKGLMVKFSDAVFNTCSPAWTIACHKPSYAYASNSSAPVGQASYSWSSNRGDVSTAPVTTVSGGFSQLGSRGLTIRFNPQDSSDWLEAGNEFYVICSGPVPVGYNISSLNYGNVTVSTESDVKCVQFEVESGAVELSTVKFGLQSHGTFAHHVTGNGDTYFRFGTVGPAANGVYNSYPGVEWWPTVTAADLAAATKPDYLAATKDNLLEVSTADDSEAVGSVGLQSDPIYLNIRLGSAETGANSQINNRLYFDYA